MVLIKMFVAFIWTKLQRFESRANGEKTYLAASLEVSSPKRTPEARMVKNNVIFEVGVEFYPSTTYNSPNPPIFSPHILQSGPERHSTFSLHSFYFQSAVTSSK